MNGMMVLVAAMSMGIDTGYQPIAGGGYEYIIQIDAQALESLAAGTPIITDVPPNMRFMRRFRITYGSDPLPNQGRELPSEERKVVPVPANGRGQVPLPGPGSREPPAIDSGEEPAEEPDAYRNDDSENDDPSGVLSGRDNTKLGSAPARGTGATDPFKSSPVPRRGSTDNGTTASTSGKPASDKPARGTSGGPSLTDPNETDNETASDNSNVPGQFPMDDNVQLAAVGANAPDASTGSKSKNPAKGTNGDSSKNPPSKVTAEAGVHWTWWSITVLGLVASGAGNVYLGWMWWELRNRYRALVGSIDEVDA